MNSEKTSLSIWFQSVGLTSHRSSSRTNLYKHTGQTCRSAQPISIDYLIAHPTSTSRSLTGTRTRVTLPAVSNEITWLGYARVNRTGNNDGNCYVSTAKKKVNLYRQKWTGMIHSLVFVASPLSWLYEFNGETTQQCCQPSWPSVPAGKILKSEPASDIDTYSTPLSFPGWWPRVLWNTRPTDRPRFWVWLEEEVTCTGRLYQQSTRAELYGTVGWSCFERFIVGVIGLFSRLVSKSSE